MQPASQPLLVLPAVEAASTSGSGGTTASGSSNSEHNRTLSPPFHPAHASGSHLGTSNHNSGGHNATNRPSPLGRPSGRAGEGNGEGGAGGNGGGKVHRPLPAPALGPDPLLDNPRYEKVQDLSSGSFGVVLLAKRRSAVAADMTTPVGGAATSNPAEQGTDDSEELVAIKFIERSERVNRYVEAEILNHRMLRHPHVIEFKEVFLTEKHIAIAMEYAGGGSLFTYVQRAGRLQERAARWFFQQLIIGLDYCHRKGVVNRDMKLENTLLTMMPGLPLPLIKICDFGYSKGHHMSAPKSTVGTLAYMAPEVIKMTGQYDGQRSDVWSCGVMLYVMLFGAYPFEHPAGKGVPHTVRMHGMMKRILLMHWSFPAEIEVGADCKDLLQKLLVLEPSQRLPITDVQAHPWFRTNLPPNALTMNQEFLEQPDEEGLQSEDEIRALLATAATVARPGRGVPGAKSSSPAAGRHTAAVRSSHGGPSHAARAAPSAGTTSAAGAAPAAGALNVELDLTQELAAGVAAADSVVGAVLAVTRSGEHGAMAVDVTCVPPHESLIDGVIDDEMVCHSGSVSLSFEGGAGQGRLQSSAPLPMPLQPSEVNAVAVPAAAILLPASSGAQRAAAASTSCAAVTGANSASGSHHQLSASTLPAPPVTDHMHHQTGIDQQRQALVMSHPVALSQQASPSLGHSPGTLQLPVPGLSSSMGGLAASLSGQGARSMSAQGATPSDSQQQGPASVTMSGHETGGSEDQQQQQPQQQQQVEKLQPHSFPISGEEAVAPESQQLLHHQQLASRSGSDLGSGPASHAPVTARIESRKRRHDDAMLESEQGAMPGHQTTAPALQEQGTSSDKS